MVKVGNVISPIETFVFGVSGGGESEMEKVKRTWKLFSHRRFVRAFHVVLIRKFSVNNWHSPRSWLAVEECLRANRCDSVLGSPSGSAREERGAIKARLRLRISAAVLCRASSNRKGGDAMR